MKDAAGPARIAVVVSIFALAPASAMAYIDPGNGAYMVQVIFTLVGAALFYLRHPIRSIKALWQFVASRRRQSSSDLQRDNEDRDPGSLTEYRSSSEKI